MVAATLSLSDHHSGLTYDLIRRIIARACPACMRAFQEDLVQKAMVRVTCAFRKDQERSLNRTYLRAVARSVVLDEIRRQRHRSTTRPDTSSVERAESGTFADPEQAARVREILRLVDELLQHRLGPRRAEAVRLHLQGCSVLETAQQMGVPRKSAENLVYRGLRDLRAGLRERGVHSWTP